MCCAVLACYVLALCAVLCCVLLYLTPLFLPSPPLPNRDEEWVFAAVLTPRPRLQSRRYRRRHCRFSCLSPRRGPPWYAQSAAANLVRAESTWPKFQRSSSRRRRMPEELSTEFATSGSRHMRWDHPSWSVTKSLVCQGDPLTLRRTALANVLSRASLACRRHQRIKLAIVISCGGHTLGL